MEWSRADIKRVAQPQGWEYRPIRDLCVYTYEDGRVVVTTVSALRRILDGLPESTNISDVAWAYADTYKNYWKRASIALDTQGKDSEVKVGWLTPVEAATSIRVAIVKREDVDYDG